MKRVLIVVEHYLPGFKAGGPVRSVANMVNALGTETDFYIFARNHDMYETVPYAGLPADTWVSVGRARVWYTSGASHLRRVIDEIRPDVIYLNSIFSSLSVRAIVLRSLLRIDSPLVLAPRGELAPGALQYRRLKKQMFLAAAQLMRIYEGVRWQATSEDEVAEIESRAPTRDKQIILTPLFTSDSAHASRPAKQPGQARVVFASRISPKKNLEMALRIAGKVRSRISLNIVGPVGDGEYWRRCGDVIAALPSNIAVTYRGALRFEDLQRELGLSDLFVLPTHGENHGHAIVEAMAAGCPVLISDRTPWRGLTSHKAGWDLPLADETRFVDVIERVASMADDEHQTWREGARAFAASIDRREEALAKHRLLFA